MGINKKGKMATKLHKKFIVFTIGLCYNILMSKREHEQVLKNRDIHVS